MTGVVSATRFLPQQEWSGFPLKPDHSLWCIMLSFSPFQSKGDSLFKRNGSPGEPGSGQGFLPQLIEKLDQIWTIVRDFQ